MKKFIFILISSFVLFIIVNLVIAQSSFKLGTEEIQISKELKEGQVMTYNIEPEANIDAISYYIRAPNTSICWLRLYDPDGKSIYRKDFGQLFSRFLGRSESYIIQNLTSGKHVLEIIAPSYQSCIYELYLKGLTKEQLIAMPDTELHKINQEIIKKESTINSLNQQINELKREINNSAQKIENLNKEKEKMGKEIQVLKNEKSNAERKIRLLYSLIIVLFLTNLILYFIYKNKLKIKKK